ncbi:fimbrial protein [Pantoea sp. BAV 3049]|uniref:fimbrial protein n=1 Tax=Pantoea sp. BAV 3049 TaxID=2654188 RepID=UPI00131E593C|nr:fimbrial protein [Pantoea sp. BAV 3049]
MRNFKLTVCALALGMMASSSFVYAAGEVTQGTVEFNGELINETCSIDADSQAIVVTLPTLSTTTLASPGATGGSKLFDINVSGCPTGTDAGITQVAAHFEAIGGTGTNATTGNLTNVYSGTTADPAAGNVEVRLYNSNEEPLALGQTGDAATISSTGTATMRYYGGYYATAATTAGKVNAKAQFTLAYP